MSAELQSCFDDFQQRHPPFTCRVNGQDWQVIAAGEGQSLLLLPGFFGVAGTDFLYILALKQKYRVLSLTYPETSANVAELVEGLAGLMDELGIAQAHLLGGSYSGYVAQVFVRRYPQRLSKLILAQTGAPRRKHLLLAWILSSLFRGLPQGLLRSLMRQTMNVFLSQAAPQQVFWRAYFSNLIRTFSRRAIDHRFRVVLDYHRHYRFSPADLADWPGAILILESAHDSLLSQDDLELMRRLYPQAQRYCVSGDHIQSVDQPDAQIAAIQHFLSSP